MRSRVPGWILRSRVLQRQSGVLVRDAVLAAGDKRLPLRLRTRHRWSVAPELGLASHREDIRGDVGGWDPVEDSVEDCWG